MERQLKITAVCGWAISPEWFSEHVSQFFPTADVRAVYPNNPSDPEEAKRCIQDDPSHLYIGHSLGSLWLLHHQQYIPAEARKALLAPILAFTRDKDLGGKTHPRQLKWFSKIIQRNIQDAYPFQDFYKRCNIDLPESLMSSLPDRPTLIRGLDFLTDVSVPGSAANDFIAILGDRDDFLDPGELQRKIQHLEIVQGTGHNPDALLKRLVTVLNGHSFDFLKAEIGVGNEPLH